MMEIDATALSHTALNEAIRRTGGEAEISGCLGQRFIGAGMSNRKIRIAGVPGNAMGAYLNGAYIETLGNAQDAAGDTMNAGTIVVRGDIGDTAGYAMRGGEIYVRGSAGYRTGIHMKAYREMLPVIVIGGKAGSFLGEYQAGGLIIVLGLQIHGDRIAGDFPCTGMHGGKMYLRSDCADIVFPEQVTARPASGEDKSEVLPYIAKYCTLFDYNVDAVMDAHFTVITPDSRNPYKQMYVAN
ncbi:MAG: glutamate synthase [Clostridiales bacterium]|nr:glutamate synthase [Clostridiales bacterium]